MAHPLEGMMDNAMAKLKELVDVDTVVGRAIEVAKDTLVIPVSRVTMGFVTGGGEYGTKNPVLNSGVALDNSNRAFPFAGTMTAGISLKPVAFLCVQNDRVSVLPAESDEPLDRLVASIPTLAGEARSILSALQRGREEA